MKCIDCSKLKGRQKHICTGVDDNNIDIGMDVQKRITYLTSWFPDISYEKIIEHIREANIERHNASEALQFGKVNISSSGKVKPCKGCGQKTEIVGTLLKIKIQKLLNIKPTSGCNCTNLATEMDKWGVVGCIANREKILDQLVSNKSILIESLRDNKDSSIVEKISGVALDILPDILLNPILRFCAGVLLDSAIEQARILATQSPPKKAVKIKKGSVRMRPLNSLQLSLYRLALSKKPSREDVFTDTPVVHFGAHLWPIKEAWEKHIAPWNELAEKINGRCIIGVGTDENTDSFEYVKTKFSSRFELFEIKNTPEGENPTYRELINKVPSGQNDVLIYCHAKGVRSHTRVSESVKIWTEHMYETVVFNYEKAIEKFKEGYKCFGSYRTFADIPLSPKYRWHYSGTFFVVRAKYLKNTIVKSGYGGVECWPGNNIESHYSYCDFMDSAPLLVGYDINEMYPVVVDAQMNWEVERLGGPRCEQHKRELDWFLGYVKNTDRILVIGSKHGGLEYQIKKQFPEVKIVSCDISPQEDNTEYVIRGDSADPVIREKIKADGPYDLVFIDGDHTYSGVKRDWEFSLSLNPRIIAFHDIADAVKHRKENCEVDILWREIKSKYNTKEKIVGCGWGGIGVVII